jgi:hypothetical protein
LVWFTYAENKECETLTPTTMEEKIKTLVYLIWSKTPSLKITDTYSDLIIDLIKYDKSDQEKIIDQWIKKLK